MAFGKSLELFFVNGKPDEMLTARVFNWTGHVLKTPRTQIKDALDRLEAQFTGIYLLLGNIDGSPYAYIGESECLADRIKQHDVKKDWWNDAVLVTTNANELNKAHVKYLESRLIQLAQQAKAASLENGTSPPPGRLGEASTSNMEEFLDTLLVVLPAIGINLFANKAAPVPKIKADAAPTFVLFNKKHGISAKAQILDGGFVVRKDSLARATWEGKGGSYQTLHAKLREDGILVAQGDLAIFATDYEFDSPSAAAAVCHGRSANGRTEWTNETSGLTYASWEAKNLSIAAP